MFVRMFSETFVAEIIYCNISLNINLFISATVVSEIVGGW
jgi:hypothetical protein